MAAIEPEVGLALASADESERADPAAVRSLVGEVNRIVVRKHLEAAHEVGILVLDRYFAGDPVAFQEGRLSHASYRALASHPDLSVSASWLWYAVRLVGHLDRLPVTVATQLPLSHHRLLMHVDEPHRMKALAQDAVESGWSRRELRKQIDTGRSGAVRTSGSRRGRPPMPPVRKALRKVVECMELDGHGPPSMEVFEHWEPVDALALVAAARARIGELETLCGQLEELAALWKPGESQP